MTTSPWNRPVGVNIDGRGRTRRSGSGSAAEIVVIVGAEEVVRPVHRAVLDVHRVAAGGAAVGDDHAVAADG